MNTSLWHMLGPDGSLWVHAIPKSSRSGVDGLRTGPEGQPQLVVRVSAPPDKGKANKAVLRVLAEALCVPVSALTLLSGETSRRKRIKIAKEYHGTLSTR